MYYKSHTWIILETIPIYNLDKLSIFSNHRKGQIELCGNCDTPFAHNQSSVNFGGFRNRILKVSSTDVE